MGPPLEVTFKEEVSEEGADQAVKFIVTIMRLKGQLEAHPSMMAKESFKQPIRSCEKNLITTKK